MCIDGPILDNENFHSIEKFVEHERFKDFKQIYDRGGIDDFTKQRKEIKTN
jgi:thioredoxin-related protein